MITDIRRAIYDRVIAMSPGFYERVLTGEVLSRLTTDTTLVLSVIGSSVSVALRNVLTLLGGLALLFWTSPKLTALVLVGVPLVVVPILTLGRRLRRLSRQNQDRIAASSAQASESLLAAQTVQAYTHEAAEPRQLRRADRGRLRLRPRPHPHPRAPDRHRHLPRLRLRRRASSGSAPATCAPAA